MQRPNVEKMREQYSQYFMGGKPITVNLKDDIYSLFDYIDELEKEKENQPKRPNVEYAKLIAEYIHPFKENFVLDLCNYIEHLEKESVALKHNIDCYTQRIEFLEKENQPLKPFSNNSYYQKGYAEGLKFGYKLGREDG